MSEENKEFPVMTVKESFETDQKYFTITKGSCDYCGSKRRYWTTKSTYAVFCYDCEPEGELLLKCQINMAEKDKAKRIKKKKKANWVIPVVISDRK